MAATKPNAQYHHRLSQAKKEANDFAWYKHHIDLLDTQAFGNVEGWGGVSEVRRIKTNYDLFNNQINKEDFEYVCKPYGDAGGELPANFTNYDIVSGKIKALLGMEMKRPFSWKVFAVNEEATTRKEQHEFGLIKQFVVSEIMKPIEAEIRKAKMAQMQGRQLSPQQQQEIEQQVAQEVKAMTPEEVKKYMARDHQDPAEALMSQLLEYLIAKENIQDTFNDGWKHGLLSGYEIFWQGIGANGPVIQTVNPMRFDYDKSPDIKFIEDGEWAAAEYWMTPSQVVSMFSNELDEQEIDKIYSYTPYGSGQAMEDATFTFNEREEENFTNTIRVLHVNLKSLKKIGFLTYVDQRTGTLEQDIVEGWYKFTPEAGDIAIDWQYIPEVHEGYKIGTEIYKRLRPVAGQFYDINNLFDCKLSYMGAAFDNTNSEVTSLMDRMKSYQFYYDIIMYRIEMLMASDKGKWMFMNMNMIPTSLGVDLKKFLYYGEAMKIGFLNPNEEGTNKANPNIGEAVKEVDLSLVTQIDKYIQLAEYIETRCGNSVGITKPIEGQTAPQDAVRNAQMNYQQSSYILEPYFDLHNQIKKRVLNAYMNTASVYYSDPKNAKKLTYVIDDMSMKMLDIDTNLLSTSTYGLFVANSSKSWEAKQAIEQLGHAAMQNQKAELSDIIKVMRSESVQEAEELLKVAEQNAHERQVELQTMSDKYKAEEAEKGREFIRETWQHEKDMIILKEEERRKTEIQKQTILSLGFNEDKDVDDDGTPDVLEVAKLGMNAQIKMNEQQLKREQFEYQKEQDKIDNKLKEEKLAIDRKKASKPSSK